MRVVDRAADTADAEDGEQHAAATRGAVSELACGLAGIPRDLEAAANSLDRHLRVERAKQ